MSDQWDLKILCMGAGYVGGPTMAVIAKMCPKVRTIQNLEIDYLCPYEHCTRSSSGRERERYGHFYRVT